jgi:hypothetical protein
MSGEPTSAQLALFTIVAAITIALTFAAAVLV